MARKRFKQHCVTGHDSSVLLWPTCPRLCGDMLKKRKVWQVEGGDTLYLPCPGEATSWILCLILRASLKKNRNLLVTGIFSKIVNPVKGHKDDQWPKHLLYKASLRDLGHFSLEKTEGRSHHYSNVSEVQEPSGWCQAFLLWGITTGEGAMVKKQRIFHTFSFVTYCIEPILVVELDLMISSSFFQALWFCSSVKSRSGVLSSGEI